MKTMRVTALLLVLLTTVGCLAACGAETVYNLKIDYPAIYPVLVKWAEYLKEKSNGRINARIYAAGALGSIVDCVTNCESGVTDGFWSAMNLYPGTWPLCDVFMLPMLGSNKMEVQVAAMQDMLKEKDFAAEWKNLKLVAMHSSTPSTFIFADSVDSMQAMKGKTVRTLSNYTTPWLEALAPFLSAFPQTTVMKTFKKASFREACGISIRSSRPRCMRSSKRASTAKRRGPACSWPSIRACTRGCRRI